MKQSAGILLYRKKNEQLEFFLVHPGGPFFMKKQEGWWTIPKGEIFAGEAPLDTAIREFKEETGHEVSAGFIELQPIVQKAGKKVFCWATDSIAVEPENVISNTFEIEWPPRSGRMQVFPEIDKAGWFNYDKAAKLINDKQLSFLDELISLLK